MNTDRATLVAQTAARLMLHMSTHHKGASNGVRARELAAALCIGGRHLRRAVSAAREEGAPICARPETGYFLAQTPVELREAAAFLEHRALTSLHLLARMRGVSLPQLLGQLSLPT